MQANKRERTTAITQNEQAVLKDSLLHFIRFQAVIMRQDEAQVRQRGRLKLQIGLNGRVWVIELKTFHASLEPKVSCHCFGILSAADLDQIGLGKLPYQV